MISNCGKLTRNRNHKMGFLNWPSSDYFSSENEIFLKNRASFSKNFDLFFIFKIKHFIRFGSAFFFAFIPILFSKFQNIAIKKQKNFIFCACLKFNFLSNHLITFL